ncbi:hypothetical protein [Ureibacillus aquaedulcis]|uniref:Uncharacterized protein n=1 Tax=Ureibacillus aquaedulcis TaxID=3058421 RepID=A0ABT8GPV4_9BACL|nr:hypothetical protein [Ureibacillus sp. BA0131]MDN4493448.1 hypothetical protein [Ureibacillus sp. BA0131]
MNLDEQLRNLTRAERSTSEKEKTLQLIQSKLEKNRRKSSWSYGIVLVSMCTVFLFLLLTSTATFPINEVENTSAPFGEIDEQTTIEKVFVLENTNPQSNLNLKSIFYPLKESTAESESFDEIFQILHKAKEHAVPWDGTIFDENSGKDFHFQFSNDKELYVKLNTEQTKVLIDPYAKMKYVLANEEWKVLNLFYYETAENQPWSTTKKVILASAFILFIGSGIVFQRLEKKSLKTRTESEDNQKSYPFLKGTISIIGVLSYVIKYLIQKQPILWNYKMIQWSICISFLVFLVFFI